MSDEAKRKVFSCDTTPSINDGEQIIAYLNQLYENAKNPTISQSSAVAICLDSIIHHIENTIEKRVYERFTNEEGMDIDKPESITE